MSGPKKKIEMSKAEIAFLDAMIAFEKEEKAGVADKITVLVDPAQAALWTGALVKAGAWAWRNKYKLLAVGQAVWDLIGADLKKSDITENSSALDAIRPTLKGGATLQDLIRLREQITEQQK